MNVFKRCGTFVLLIVCTFYVQIQATDLCGDWFKLNDDKCYKIYHGKLYTFPEANNFCSGISENDLSSMVTIRSKEEQDYWLNWVIKLLNIVDNFWIGAKYDNGTFHWVDNSTLGYTNWLKATKNKTNTCVQVQVEEGWIGKWLDVSCAAKSLVVCEKVRWSRARLEKAYDEAQHRLQVSTAEANQEIRLQNGIISQAKKTIEEANQTIAQQEHKIQEANQKLTRPTNEIYQANEEFRKLENRIAESAKVLKYPLFPGCSWREFLVVDFNSSCYESTCTLFRNKLYTFEMKFVANQNSQTVHVNRTFTNAELTDNMDNEDGCKYVKCPLVKGQEYSFIVDKYHINFANIEDSFRGNFQITLTGDHGTLACFSTGYRLYDNSYARTTPRPRL